MNIRKTFVDDSRNITLHMLRGVVELLDGLTFGFDYFFLT